MLFTLNADTAGTTPESSRSGSVNVVVSGTWGAGTISFQVYDQESSSWVTLYNNTANFALNILVGAGNSYRFTLTGATGPNLSAYVIPVFTKDLNV